MSSIKRRTGVNRRRKSGVADELWTIVTGELNYPGGIVYADGIPSSASDAWFREGIIIPEPATVSQFSLAARLLVRRRCKLKGPW